MDIVNDALPWYVAGPLIGLMVPLLLLLGNRQFGISASFQDLCAWCVRRPSGYFKWDPQNNGWRLWMVLGMIGGALAISYLLPTTPVDISPATQADLAALEMAPKRGLYPIDLLGGDGEFSITTILVCIVGGLLVGFGTRYAGGCTSGHSIMGLAQFSPASLVATIAFFAGGLLMTHFIFPHLIPALLHG
jgi:uncharacterized membrane protein YedE/YeeE